MIKVLRVLLLSSFIFILFWDNLRKWNAEGSSFFLSRYFFEPMSFHQYGWGMYSFDIHRVRSLRYHYELSNGETTDVDSAYGHIPSFKKTLLGNLDIEIASGPGNDLVRHLAQFKCRNPDPIPVAPLAVTVRYVYRKVPKLFGREWDEGQVSSVIDAYRAECIR